MLINDESKKKNKKNIIYNNDNGDTSIHVRLEGETLWLTQAQLVDLFESSTANISEHIKNIYNEGELNSEVIVRNFRTIQKEGTREVVRNMVDYICELDNILQSTGRKLLENAGNISHEEAKEKAKNLSEIEKSYLESIKSVGKTVKKKVNSPKQ